MAGSLWFDRMYVITWSAICADVGAAASLSSWAGGREVRVVTVHRRAVRPYWITSIIAWGDLILLMFVCLFDKK